MTTQEAKNIRIADYLQSLGYTPVKQQGNSLWYKSPLREERDASFKVNTELNRWYDFGLGKGGNIIALAAELYHTENVACLLKRIEERTPYIRPASFSFSAQQSDNRTYRGLRVGELSSPALIAYLQERGINIELAKRECMELRFMNADKPYFAIGFPNMAGGYEVRSCFFKGCVPPKSVSLVKLEDTLSNECLVFEGFMDFLSAVTLGVTGNADCLVLNSVANVEKAAGLLDGYGRIGCFLDRDDAGRRTLAALVGRYGERVTDRSFLYDGCKDLNEYLQQTTKKQKKNHLKIEEQ